MKKKIKKAVKAFFKPSMKHDCISLQDQLNALQSRFNDLENDHLYIMREMQQLYNLVNKQNSNED
jgi:hypothetical protein|tara:strand:+ start:712 stop:906 length:195 start_codon:yes stop_codon:yes gene_type:complete